jgi:Mg2+-importing ATPase
VEVFAEILPAQKERIVMAIKKGGHSIGFLGDGINDANALKAADVGISINNAVDVAKEAADVVLLDRNIDVIREGVLEGRKTFMNTLKYIYLSTSANFGNMFSMAVISLFLPFFPLLPIQILLNNFLSDIPAFAIASDRVDPELIKQPRSWNFAAIRKFMIIFGLQSSVFDFATFALLIYYFKASATEFRTAWFMESLLTEILILLVIRTSRPFYKSRPSSFLMAAVIFCFILSLTIPYLPLASVFSLYALPITLVGSLLVLVLLYFMGAELIKKTFKMKI